MTYARFAMGFPRHKKVARLSDAAFRLWASAIAYAREQLTDGALEASDLDVIPRCPPAGAKRQALVDELVTSELWEVTANGWRVHDYLDWNDSAEQVKARQANARKRMRDVRANTHRTVVVRASEVRSTDLDRTSGSGSESESPEGVQGEPEPDRETVCPLNLLERPGVRAALRELAENLPAPLASLEAEAREFVSYWTIGKGQGRQRLNWPKELRERLRKRFHEGALKAPGAVEHERRSGVRVAREEPTDLRERGVSAETARLLGPDAIRRLGLGVRS